MAIAYDNSSKGTIATSSTNTFSHTCAGTNRYLFVGTSSNSNSVSYNGTSMTSLGTYYENSYATGITIWGLSSPTTGTHDVSVTNSSATITDEVMSVSYSGVDPSPFEASAGFPQAYNSTGITGTVTTLTANAWVGMLVKGDNSGQTFTAGASTTLRQVTASGGGNRAAGVFDSNAAKATPGNYSLIANWGSSTGPLNAAIYSIKPYLAVTLTGPASGNVNAASTNFTLTPDVVINGTVTITPSGAGSAGLSATVLTFSNSSVAQTFTITPLTAGAITLTITNTVGLNNAAALTYTANAVVPSAPTIGTATPLNASASVTFTDNSDGGSAITNHTATSTPGSFTGTSATSPITVSGLSNGTPYTFVVKATNAVGDSSNSSASNSATPYVPASSFTFTGPASGNVRAASTNFTVTPNSTYNGTITITPTGTASTGLSPTILTFNLSSAAQTFTITPTTSGSITLTPTNSNGISNPSNLTYTANAVVPLAPPQPFAVPSQSSATVEFSAPTNDGGATITLYTVTSSPGGFTATSSSPGMVSITGLTNGTPYTFTVTATNSVGTSAASPASSTITPSASSTSFTNSGPKFRIKGGVGNLINF